VTSQQVAYLHLDMNCAPPEVAALTYFWDRLVAGAPVLLDDYAYHSYTPQRLAMDEFAHTRCGDLFPPDRSGFDHQTPNSLEIMLATNRSGNLGRDSRRP
jgi:hypothetical protein